MLVDSLRASDIARTKRESDNGGNAEDPKMPTVEDHFKGKTEELRNVYDKLVSMVEQFGPVEQDPKKTSIHLNRTTAFAGVAVRKSHIVLTIKSDRPIENDRIFKSEQTSARRFHHEVKLESPKEVDTELRSWLKSAYALSE
jgi:hypothetical protein